ncbi:MAG: DUF86 domain-containing protein [Caldisericia bacterium]|nr:DUF86 domain-containing protein [Caldisericia bacterium]MDD4614340.1 DUF86 domain-containing protein [Caldisericia bacterium]
MVNELILAKKNRLERCVQQIYFYFHQPSAIPFEENYLVQDAIAINMQRVCDLCIDIANIIIKEKKIGLPSSSKDSFQLLKEASFINEATCNNLCNMVGFRNILVHTYEKLNIGLVKNLIEERKLDDIIQFASEMLTLR